ncbi:MAG: cob(I)yrinic acid a,c-diamide adenosyltransferase [Gemmatimonadetes bacterium]|nr:cob(I)yrinic acid a,c-diamide adenosyltransferase [Gemmatimonadota bacterium]NIO30609.1 cob(I)yrinic acid a,c-diamide adenosyltransferase [Gemmatimonadota bacterium]
MKIYTRKGDGGETSLFGGRRVRKDELRVEAYGTVDELNSTVGLVGARLPSQMEEWRDSLIAIQSDLFTIGAILATPKTGAAKPEHIPELAEVRVETLEDWIDKLDEELTRLKVFVLPGGSELAATLHLARSVCRRAERRVVTLANQEEVEPVVIKYLNRLSDFLFTLARAANARQGVADVEWHPESET